MTRTLSSLQTFFVKIIFPAFWIIGVGIQTVYVFLGESPDRDPPPKWLFLLFFVFGSGLIYRQCIRLKKVSVDSNTLYVSNYLKEISIPLSEICDVTENRWLNSHPVTIHLRFPSDFGDKIVFMPEVRFFAFFSSHPVVRELKGLARSCGAQISTR